MPRKRPPAPGGQKKRAEGKADASPAYKPFAKLKSMRAEVSDKPAAPPPKPKEAPPATLPEDDALSLHRMMSGVTPLDGRPTRIPRSQSTLERSPSRAEEARVAEVAEVEAVQAHLRALIEDARFEVTDDGKHVEGRRLDLPPGILRKLRHGGFALDARIDLHGLGAAKARDELERFLADKRARGERCVLVIHGKGHHSPRGVAVLRGEIAAWLSQGAASVHVAAFATAAQDDGGEGAVYVLLAR